VKNLVKTPVKKVVTKRWYKMTMQNYGEKMLVKNLRQKLWHKMARSKCFRKNVWEKYCGKNAGVKNFQGKKVWA